VILWGIHDFEIRKAVIFDKHRLGKGTLRNLQITNIQFQLDGAMHIKTFKNNKSPYLIHKVCPYCGEANEKSAIRCDACGKYIIFHYGDDVCLNCGHMGRMKKKYELKRDPLIGLFFGGTLLPTHRGAVIGKICKKCKREIRDSDYEIA
jgi:ribosomal protein L32